MVDVGNKPTTERTAVAEGFIQMQETTLQMIDSHNHKKGDVLGVARLAGIMAAKKTSDLIPLCHPISISHVSVEFESLVSLPGIRCEALVQTVGQTGVEMEALTAVHIALLTVYDMCKAVDRGMRVKAIGLLKKQGGKSGDWTRTPTKP